MSTAEPSTGPRTRTVNLPVEVDSFVGRRRELDEIRQQFGSFPLVTLVGSGGVGKTRLALRAAHRLRRSFTGGVWFVELADLQDPALLAHSVAEALDLREQSSAVTARTLADHLAERTALLVLDNCEHLVDEVAVLADGLLRSCPHLRLLATSRERLGVHGEAILQVQPLTFPDGDIDTSADALPRFEAVALFTQRATAVLPEFSLTASNGADVAHICRQLDGVPLALELAAARLRTLSPRELASRLADRYRVLVGGSRGAPSRHQTMRLCVDWSYEQCTTLERLLWTRLSVFVGSFELDAVEGICAFGDLEEHDVLDVLSSLVEKSIVTRDRTGETTHFRLLETLREYGLEKVQEAGELAGMRARHRDWYEQLVRRFRDDLISPRQLSWTERLDRELPNVRAALEYSLISPHEATSAQRIAGDLHLFWISRGLLSEGRYWLGRALAADDVSTTHDRAAALFSAVALAGFQGDTDAAARWVADCGRLAEASDSVEIRAYLANVSGMLALFTGDLDTAVSELARAVEGHRATGDLLREVEILIGLALASGLAGDSERAATAHERVLAITEPRGESWYQAYALWALGISLWRRGVPHEAAEKLQRSLRLRNRMGDLMGSAWCVEGLALVAGADEEWERAAVLLGASAALSDQAGTPPATFPDLAAAFGEATAAVRRALGDQRYDRAQARGLGMGVTEAVAFALAEQPPEVAVEEPAWSALTRREREVAELVAEGLANRSIAERLVISPRTAENHVLNILTKLGLNSRSQIAAWVAAEGPSVGAAGHG